MPTTPLFDTRAWQGSGWRAVEAQHKNATISLVHGNLADQALLEDIIETVKPPAPMDTHGLHYLLATPFRYQSPPPAGSRFRRRSDPAAFYGAEDVRTACAEVGYWRYRFWSDSAQLRQQPAVFAMTVFEFHGTTKHLLDLTHAPYVEQRAHWTHSTDYHAPQTLAADARQAGVEIIRFESVRNAPDGRCLAILTPAVFRAVREPYRHQQQTWSLHLQPSGHAVWQRTLDGDVFEFTYAVD